jgi:transposase-like protein
MNKVICPVCGYPDLHSMALATCEICSSCGFQFDVTDLDLGYTFEQWREKWIKEGIKFHWRKDKPANWDPKRQLLNIGVKI